MRDNRLARPKRKMDTMPQAQEHLLAAALSSVANAIFITDADGHILWNNQAFSSLTGYAPEELAGRSPNFLNSGKNDDACYASLWRTVLSGEVWRGELVDRRKDGSLYVVDEVITPLLDKTGKVTHFVAVQHELGPRDEQRLQDHYLAYHDELTGLGNRLYFLSALHAEIEQAVPLKHSFATLFIDLDGFKPVNDRFGHHIGDALLVAVGERLRAAVRKGDTVARHGGDEFAILLRGELDHKAAAALAAKLATAIAQPYLIEGRKIAITGSIGVAIFPGDGVDPDILLRNADRAMYEAKQRGGGFQFS